MLLLFFLVLSYGFQVNLLLPGGVSITLMRLLLFCFVLSVIKLFWQRVRVCCIVLGFVSGIIFFSVLERISCFNYFLWS